MLLLLCFLFFVPDVISKQVHRRDADTEATAETTSSWNPCDNFYKYNCEKYPAPRVQPKLHDVRLTKMSGEVDQYQEYVVPTREPARRLWEVLNPDLISKWLVQFDTFRDGTHWEQHKKRHEVDYPRLDPIQKRSSLVDLVAAVEKNFVEHFYISLKKSVENIEELRIPVSTKNHFYHGLFDEIRDMHISEIKSYSHYNEAQKQQLIDSVKNIKIIFPYLEYNDIKIWRAAKTAYEREYYRLKSAINETEIPADVIDKMLRIASVDPAVSVFEKYMKDFSPRFVFQHLNAAATRDSFNYQNEVHVSVFTMIDPHLRPENVYNQFLFVLNHEMQHVHFNIDPPPFEPEIFAVEKNCVISELKKFTGEIKNVNPDWNMEDYFYEDMSNVAALRLFVKYHALKNSDEQKVRDALEKSMSTFCSTRVTNREHNPHDTSINTAVSQIPTFNKLYNCTPGQHLYIEPENLCRTLNMYLDEGDFKPQKITEEELYTLTQYMDVLEDTAIDLDAANITTFEGELFDITVEDVEEKEEELEGSAASSESSSSESQEVVGEEDGDDEIKSAEEEEDGRQSAEIVSSARSIMSAIIFVWTLAIAFY